MAIKYTALATVNDEKMITAAITSCHTRIGSAQLDIHRILVAVCVRWNTSGDVRPVAKHVNHLLSKEKMGGIRKNAIKEWVETFMKLEYINEGEFKGQFFAPKTINDGQHLDLQELTNNRWWEFKVEADYQPITDPKKIVAQMITKLEKDRTKMGDKSKVDPALIASLKAATVTEPLH